MTCDTIYGEVIKQSHHWRMKKMIQKRINKIAAKITILKDKLAETIYFFLSCLLYVWSFADCFVTALLIQIC